MSSVLGTLLEEPRTAGSNAGLYAGLGVAAVAALAAAAVTPPKANSRRKE